MQLLHRTTLFCQDGRSDKVYEVDLVQTSSDRYVVNFRYGRRGSTLKEGAKTVSAVPLEAAERIMQQLIREKLRKGYHEGESSAAPPSTAPTPAPAPVVSANPNGRNQLILDRLAAAVGRPTTPTPTRKHWPLDRVIWRAGELGLSTATPLLIQILEQNRPNPLQQYGLVWALGNCGDMRTVPVLEALYRRSDTSEFVQRIALEAIAKLSPAKGTALRSEMTAHLPPEVRSAIHLGEKALLETVQRYLETARPAQFILLDQLYQINSEVTRPVILEIIKTAPFRFNYFQRLRHIFKIAEYRRDSEVFSLFAYRIEQEAMGGGHVGWDPNTGRPLWISHNGSEPMPTDVDWRRAINLKDPETKVAFLQKTRSYLRRRVWRTLQHLGQLNHSDYVQMAAEILLRYSDDDAEPNRESIYYMWERRTWNRVERSRRTWDRFARYFAFNHILYHESDRYECPASGRAWRCKGGYRPGDPEPTKREEAFPHLWEQQPAVLLRLLLESQCQPVHQFAAKALRSCPDFCQAIETPTLLTLLGKPYEVTAQLGFELARTRYQPDQPDYELVGAIANCAYAPARAEAYGWILADRDRFLADAHFITQLVTSPEAETRTFARQLLSTSILSDEIARSLIAQIIAWLLTCPESQPELAAEVADTVMTCFRPQLRSLGLSVVLDLLRHPLAEVQAFGAEILLNHETSVTELPPGLIDALLESPHESVRVIGVRLFGQLPDSVLTTQTQLILTLATHSLKPMREAIAPTLRRLCANDATLRQTLVSQLLTLLSQPEPHEGVHRFLAHLLQTEITDWMTTVPQAIATQLLQIDSTPAQEIAGRLLQANLTQWLDSWPIAAIAQLTHQEVQAVREAGKQMLNASLPRLQRNESAILDATQVFDSKWDDARQFGYQFFGDVLQPDDFTPAIAISICDNNRAEVRQFGRDLVSRCFKAEDGQEYLLKLSEHPSTDMQLFASSYLENYASGHADRLQTLAPYFIRVLGQVNRARVAKQRIFQFLKTEATHSEAAAQIIIEILTRQSAAIAIGERARAIETLLHIHHHYPHLAVPIQVQPVPLKA